MEGAEQQDNNNLQQIPQEQMSYENQVKSLAEIKKRRKE